MASLNSRQIKEFFSLCRMGSVIEYTSLGNSVKAKVSGEDLKGGFPHVKLTDGHGTHVISEYALTQGHITKLIVNGKKII
jgi:hypothetical protein